MYFLDLPLFFAAYGDYNDLTIEVANARNQKLVNWDFEYEAFFFLSLPLNLFFSPVCSSGDSAGIYPEDQKRLYDAVVAKNPNTVLSLQHEVYSMFLLIVLST